MKHMKAKEKCKKIKVTIDTDNIMAYNLIRLMRGDIM